MEGKYYAAHMILYFFLCRFSAIGVVSFGVECPSYGVYARVTKVKNWIQFIAEGAVDSNCNQEVPYQPGGYVSIQRCPSGLQSFNSADTVL